MELTSPVLVAIVVTSAIGVPVLLVITWQRKPRGLPGALLRLVGILLAQVLAMGGAVLVANNAFGFYSSWSDLMGGGGQQDQLPLTDLVPADGALGRVEAITVQTPGARGPAGQRISVLVWLPKQYDEARFKRTKFPAMMLLGGQPSTPEGIFKDLDFAARATHAIDGGAVKPFIAVIPPLMIAPPRDTECTNVPKGPQAETWLYDVRSAAIRHLRVDPAGDRWSAMGFSTGGFCAAKLQLRRPDLFHAAVTIGGYFDALTDNTTGDLFDGDRQFRNENSPSWLIRHADPSKVNLLYVVSIKDKGSYAGKSYADGKKFIAATRGAPGVRTLLLTSGGHSFDTYRPTVSEDLAWLQETGAFG